jgi:hypothetical protein
MIHAVLAIVVPGAVLIALAVDAGVLAGALVGWLRRRWR